MTRGDVTILNSGAIDDLVATARSSPRRRKNHNFHRRLDDPIQRFLNAAEPGSYVCPHRHAADRWELFAVLRGRIDLVLFTDDGAVEQRVTAVPGGDMVEIPGQCWHSFVVGASGTVTLEVKPGPYIAASDKEFAPWAPREGDAAARRFLKWLGAAKPGERWIQL